MKKVYWLLLALLIFSGCGTQIPATKLDIRKEYFHTKKTNYFLNKQYSVTIGDVLFSAYKSDEAVTQGYKLIKEYTPPLIGGIDRPCCLNAEGMFFYPYYSTAAGILLFSFTFSVNSGMYMGAGMDVPKTYIQIDKTGHVVGGVVIEQNNKFTLQSQGIWTSEQLFEEGEFIEQVKGKITAELTFLGYTNNILKLQYNEYSNVGKDKLIRDAYTKNLEYDISANDVIQFRSVKIKVIKITSSELNFMVIDDGQLPWLD